MANDEQAGRGGRLLKDDDWHPFAKPGEWPMAQLLGRLHAIKVAAVQADGDEHDGIEYVSIQAEHNQKWYRIDASWARLNKPVVGSFLVLFPAGHVAVMDAAFVVPNLVIDGIDSVKRPPP